MDSIKYIKSKIIEKRDLLDRIAKNDLIYNSVLSLEKIQQFEFENNIELPQDYKCFISEIGNGGVGPGLGLKSLHDSIIDFKLRNRPYICLNKKFPYQDKWNEPWIASFDWDDDYPESEIVDKYMDTKHISGCLQIAHRGHGCTYLLVVNGFEFGNVWLDNRADYSGMSPILNKENRHITFGEWYADWITNLI